MKILLVKDDILDINSLAPLLNRQEVIKRMMLKPNKRYHIDIINSPCITLQEFFVVVFLELQQKFTAKSYQDPIKVNKA